MQPKQKQEETISHWNQTWSTSGCGCIDWEDYLEKIEPAERLFFEMLPVHSNMHVLDLGCGNGLMSLYLAAKDVFVTGVDNSDAAIEAANKLSELNGCVGKARFIKDDVERVEEVFGRSELVVGKYILHHLKDIRSFAASLAGCMRSGQEAYFLENSGRNRLILFFRRFSGKFGIRKYGDSLEEPLPPGSLETFNNDFVVEVEYPVFMFFWLLGVYLVRLKLARRFFLTLDNFVFYLLPGLRKYSYRQVIKLKRR